MAVCSCRYCEVRPHNQQHLYPSRSERLQAKLDRRVERTNREKRLYEELLEREQIYKQQRLFQLEYEKARASQEKLEKEAAERLAHNSKKVLSALLRSPHSKKVSSVVCLRLLRDRVCDFVQSFSEYPDSYAYDDVGIGRQHVYERLVSEARDAAFSQVLSHFLGEEVGHDRQYGFVDPPVCECKQKATKLSLSDLHPLEFAKELAKFVQDDDFCNLSRDERLEELRSQLNSLNLDFVRDLVERLLYEEPYYVNESDE